MSDQIKPSADSLDRSGIRSGKRVRRRGELARGLSVVAASTVLMALGIATGRSATSAGTARQDDLDATIPVLAETDGDRTSLIVELPSEPAAESALSMPSDGATPSDLAPLATAAETRVYDGRPMRRARTVRMRVTAYSPDERSCGASADGITASGYSVFTNGGCLVAADPKMLPLGTILSVPGYDGGECVPVLDVGGAIKGNRLDVLFPTHEQAIAWGVRELEVDVWEFAAGKPSGFRRLRRTR